MKALIVANGPKIPDETLIRLAEGHNLIVVTDGALDKLPPKVHPNIICGDFDSVKPETLKSYAQKAEIVRIEHQDLSDLEKAISICFERGATAITLTNMLDGRIDHSLSAISTLVRYHTEIPISIAGDRTEIWIVSCTNAKTKSLILSTSVDDVVSLIPFSHEAVVSVNNVQWPLEKATIKAGTLGVSNRAKSDKVQVSIESGILAVCVLHPSWL